MKNRESIIFDGQVNAISSYNDVGLFDVLPMHENFISLIKDKIILHSNNGNKEYKINGGVLKVKDDKVDIYLGF
jgi:F0F1-type ATP synthase epsilon subunit